MSSRALARELRGRVALEDAMRSPHTQIPRYARDDKRKSPLGGQLLLLQLSDLRAQLRFVPHVSEVIQRRRVVGMLVENLGEGALGTLLVPRALIDRTELELEVDLFGLVLDGIAEDVQRSLVLIVLRIRFRYRDGVARSE